MTNDLQKLSFLSVFQQFEKYQDKIKFINFLWFEKYQAKIEMFEYFDTNPCTMTFRNHHF